MPPLPVISNVYRISPRWLGTNPPANVFHVRSAAPQTASVIGAAIGSALSGVALDIYSGVVNTYSFTSVDVLPLDGTSATVTVPLGVTVAGAGSGDPIREAAFVVSLHTAQRGSRGRGRQYVGPLVEAEQSAGIALPARTAILTTGWLGFKTNLAAGTPSLELVIASYVHADAHPVTSIRTDSVIGVQRRRLDRIR